MAMEDGNDAKVLAAKHVVDVASALRRDRAKQERIVLGLLEQGVDFRLDHRHC